MLRMNTVRLLKFILVCGWMFGYRGQTYEEMNTLLDQLFDEGRYNRLLRPLRNQSNVLQVNFTHYLTRIESFDIATGELTTAGFFEITWLDELIAWDPSQYGGKTLIPVPREKAWKPHISISNGFSNDQAAIDSSDFSPLWTTYDGNMLMVPAGTFRTKCKVDTSYYPFDVHKCSLGFIISNHETSEISFNSPSGDINTINLETNGEWEVLDTKSVLQIIKEDEIDIQVYVPMILSYFDLKRRAAFEMINNYIPIILMTNLNILTCFVRPDSGERLTFAVTIYLALVFATTALIDRMPNNSLKMPIMTYEVLTLNLVNTAGVLWSIIMVHLSKTPRERIHVPNFISRMAARNKRTQKRAFVININPKCMISKEKNDLKVEDLEKDDLDNNSIMSRNDLNLNESSDVTGPNCVITNDVTGLDVAKALDRIYFYIVLTVFILANAVYSALVLIFLNE